jgi:hypothetical protein
MAVPSSSDQRRLWRCVFHMWESACKAFKNNTLRGHGGEAFDQRCRDRAIARVADVWRRVCTVADSRTRMVFGAPAARP